MDIYVGNLPKWAGETEVRQLFERFGRVRAVEIVKDALSGESRCFGFVTMDDGAAAGSVVSALNGAEFDNRALRVNVAAPSGDGQSVEHVT